MSVTDPDWDLPLWRSLAGRFGGPVLELGCGRGRVLTALQADGHEVYGVEQDPGLTAHARAALGEDRVWLGDLTRFQSPLRFPLVLIPCNTLSLFREPTAALTTAREHLTADGALFFDLVVPGGRSWGAPPYRWARETEGGQYDPQTGRHDGWMVEAGRRTALTTWYHPLTQWPTLLRDAGLTHKATFGPDGAPATETSSIAVIYAALA